MCLSMPYTDYSNSAPWATKHYFNHKIVCSKINITSYSHTYLISNIQYKNIWRIILTAWQTFNSCCDFTVLRPLLSHIHINYLFSTFLYEILLYLVEVIVIYRSLYIFQMICSHSMKYQTQKKFIKNNDVHFKNH